MAPGPPKSLRDPPKLDFLLTFDPQSHDFFLFLELIHYVIDALINASETSQTTIFQ